MFFMIGDWIMNRKKLQKEGEKWVDDGILTNEQLQSILARYEKKDHSYLLIILAAILVSISIIVFIFSDWAQIPDVLKIVVMLAIMGVLYGIGYYVYNQNDETDLEYNRTQIIGMSLIVLGYITFGATMWLTISMYNVQIGSAWPFIIWSIVGLLLYIITPNRYLFSLALLITIYGQLSSGVNFSSFNYIIFIIFFVAYFHYAYHKGNALVHYIFAGGLAIQLIVLSVSEFEQFYWFLLFILAMYTLGLLLPKAGIQKRFLRVSIITVLFYKIYETILIQEEYVLRDLHYEPLFFIIHAILFIVVAFLLWRKSAHDLISLILFLPLIILPYAYLFIIITIFIYSIYWFIYAFQKREDSKMVLGVFAFGIGTFTVLIQFAWDTINKSLFFLIAGIILFLISGIYERRRRKEKKGGAK